MKEREELKLIIELIGKYNLPLSPILEYSIREKMEEYPEIDESNNDTNLIKEEASVTVPQIGPTSNLSIVDYGEHSIAVIGDTKPYKDSLKAMGGYYRSNTQWGPAWTFSSKKREAIQAFIDKCPSEDYSLDDSVLDRSKNLHSLRDIIWVKCPDGRIICYNTVWKTLADVVNYANPQRVSDMKINCRGYNLVSPQLIDNPIYRAAQKNIGNGFYILTYTSTSEKYQQIVKINQELQLGLEVKMVSEKTID